MRKIIHVGAEIVERAFVETNSAQETLANAEQALFDISETQTSNDIADMRESLLEFCHVMSNRQNDDTIKTGFEHADKILGGLYPSELAIVAARPSVGKTALAVNIAKHVAFSQQKTVLFVSLEMSRHELVARFIQTHAGIDGERIRQNTLSKDDYVKLDKAYNDLMSTKIHLDQTSHRTATEIAALARRYKRKHDLRLLVVDYIGLVTPENSRDPRHEQVAKSTRILKSIARELKISVLCLAQLNRQADNSSGNVRPRLAHLRESGAIEQDADVVIFIHREENDKDDEKGVSNEVEIIIAKNRNGRCGDVRLSWFGEYSRFETPTYHNDNEPSLYDIREF
jgi:replicative DNA helicase